MPFISNYNTLRVNHTKGPKIAHIHLSFNQVDSSFQIISRRYSNLKSTRLHLLRHNRSQLFLFSLFLISFSLLNFSCSSFLNINQDICCKHKSRNCTIIKLGIYSYHKHQFIPKFRYHNYSRE